MHRLRGTFPQPSGVLFRIERETQAVRKKTDPEERRKDDGVHPVLHLPFIGIDILLQLFDTHFLFRSVAVLGVLPDLRPADEQRHLGVAKRDQVVIHIPVRTDNASLLRFLMHRVLLAELAVLIELQTIRVVLLILVRAVVAAVALRALQRDIVAHPLLHPLRCES